MWTIWNECGKSIDVSAEGITPSPATEMVTVVSEAAPMISVNLLFHIPLFFPLYSSQHFSFRWKYD